MKTKLDLSKPARYPPNVSDNNGNKKKLNGPSHSGRRCLNTLGVVTTIRIMAGNSSQLGSLKVGLMLFSAGFSKLRTPIAVFTPRRVTRDERPFSPKCDAVETDAN